MVNKRVPHRLWDFCCKWCCDVANKTAGKIYALYDRTPFEATLGHTPDISSLTSFDFYDIVLYYDEVAQLPEPKRKIGRWLGEAHNFRQAMCYWIMSASGKVIVRCTVQSIPEECYNDNLRGEIKALDINIVEKFGDVAEDEKYDLVSLSEEEMLPDFVTPEYSPVEPENFMPEADDWDAEAYD
jgi:hypothetical protein